MAEYVTRTVKVCVSPKDELLHGERCTFVEVIDLGAGEFVKVTQNESHIDLANGVTIEQSEWEEVKTAIDQALSNCRKGVLGNES